MTQIETTKTTGFGQTVEMRSTTEMSLPEPIYNIIDSFKSLSFQLSKLDTLRLAMSYITHLQKTLKEPEDIELSATANVVSLGDSKFVA